MTIIGNIFKKFTKFLYVPATPITSDGIVYAWGRNHQGQCGTGAGLSVEMYAFEPMPSIVEGPMEGRKIVQISAGVSSSLIYINIQHRFLAYNSFLSSVSFNHILGATHGGAVSDIGELYLWGMGKYLQPEHISSLSGIKIVNVSCGSDYTVALDEDGNIYTFGNRSKTKKNGCLGLGINDTNAIDPVRVNDGDSPLNGRIVEKISAGWYVCQTHSFNPFPLLFLTLQQHLHFIYSIFVGILNVWCTA